MTVRTIDTLTDAELAGRRVVVRVDFNVPVDADRRVTDPARIVAAIPTLRTLAERGAKVIVLSHFGRPKGKPVPEFSLDAVVDTLRLQLAPRTVRFCPETVGPAAVAATQALENGEILLMENTRFSPGEEQNDDEFSRQLAQLGDLYVNDAFGAAHRAHASTSGVAALLRPAVGGLLMQRELAFLGGALEAPRAPFIAVLGGSKISGKIDVIEALLGKVDRLLIGGAMACTFFRALGLETGRSLVEDDRLDMARDLMTRAGDKLLLPTDAMVAPAMDATSAAHVVPRDLIVPSEAMFDIGPETMRRYAGVIEGAATVLWNGPMGVFERPPFDRGTRAVADAMAHATDRGAVTIVGGGDSAAAIAEAGLESRFTHISTGGGASLEFLEGKTLPGVAALEQE